MSAATFQGAADRTRPLRRHCISVSLTTCISATLKASIAQEIGLHHTVRINFPLGFNADIQKQYELELLDRQRTYRCCYVHDRNIMSQGGKPDSMLVCFMSAQRDPMLTMSGDIYYPRRPYRLRPSVANTVRCTGCC